MSGARPTVAQGLALLVSAAAYLLLAYATPRAHFGQLLLLLAAAFGAYTYLLRHPLPLGLGLAAALALRLLWLPATPALSDDYHRFRWDGALVAAGLNPFEHRPDELVSPGPNHLPAHSQARYRQLNSPHYYSVYPPVCQAAFGLAAKLFPTSAPGFILVLRLLLLAAEAATAGLLLALLRQWQLPAGRALLYLLNPLVVVELTGNLHFEALLITGLLAAIWLLTRRQWLASAGALALAIAAKLVPLLVLPLLLRRLGWRGALGYGAAVALGLGLLFAPFVSAALVGHFGGSLDLYFHKFEFNASLYYLARAGGFYLTGYNEIARIGTGLALLAGLWVLAVAGLEKYPTLASLPGALLAALTGYYLLATTVHPWYLTPLVALSVFTRYRYAVVWSGLVVLSYAAYRSSAYAESLPLVALEYAGVLVVLAGELSRRKLSAESL